MKNPLNTVIAWTKVPSSAVRSMRLRPRKRNITIEWWSGHYSTHSNIRKRDMLRLLNPKQSVGEWANTYAF